MHIASTRSLPRLANRPGLPQFADDPGGAQSSLPDIPADDRDAAPPIRPCGRGTVPCARSCGGSRRPRGSPSSTIEKIRGERPPGGAQSSAPNTIADGGDAVPPDLSGLARAPGHRVWFQVPQRGPWSAFPCGPPGCGPSRHGRFRTVPGTVAMARERHGPACPIFLRTARTRSLPTDPVGGAHSSVPNISADRGNAVPPDLANGLGCFRSGDSPGGARSPVPVHAAAQAALEGRRPRRLKRLGRRTPAGRGAVLCARYSCGQRGRRPSHATLWEGHSPLCPHLSTEREDMVQPLPAPPCPRRDVRRPRPRHAVQIRAYLVSTRAPGPSPHTVQLHASRAPMKLPVRPLHL
jgi:hypothetical protein